MDADHIDRWNRLSHDARAMARIVFKHANRGYTDLDSVRMDDDTRSYGSRVILRLWRELASRGYGRTIHSDGPNPRFILDRQMFLELVRSNRLLRQAPHRLGEDNAAAGNVRVEDL